MTTARKELVDTDVTRWYHCISRCVRAAYSMGEATEDRKQWIEDRLQLLAANFSISVGGFAVLDNHLRVLVRLDLYRDNKARMGSAVKEVFERLGTSGKSWAVRSHQEDARQPRFARLLFCFKSREGS